MHSENLYRSTMAMIVVMLLLSAVIYFTLSPLYTDPRNIGNGNEPVQAAGEVSEESQALPDRSN